MHNALAYTRLHNPKKIVIGIYAPDGFAPPSQPSPAKNPEPCGAKIVDAAQDGKDPKNGSIDIEKQRRTYSALTRDLRSFRDVCVYVTNPKGQFFQTMGQADRWGRVWLLPEEALYLLERGSVDIRWPASISGAATGDDDCGKTGEVEEEELGIPMSLQGAYTYFIGRGGLTLERFNVFTGLKRLGYTILRAPTWYDETEAGALGESSLPQSRPDAKTTGLFGSVWSLFGFIWNTKGVKRPSYPLIGLGIYPTYSMDFPMSLSSCVITVNFE
jgi:tRNA-splicing endonuclease subunit Sen54